VAIVRFFLHKNDGNFGIRIANQIKFFELRMFAFEQMEFVLLDQLNLIGENFVVVEFLLDKVFFVDNYMFEAFEESLFTDFFEEALFADVFAETFFADAFKETLFADVFEETFFADVIQPKPAVMGAAFVLDTSENAFEPAQLDGDKVVARKFAILRRPEVRN
jgi:hypothetical protein